MRADNHDDLKDLTDEQLLRLLYKRQDKYLEKIPKYISDRQLGLLLEHWMDVLREFRKLSQPAGGPSEGYIIEKLYRSLKRLKRKGIISDEDIEIICEEAKDDSIFG